MNLTEVPLEQLIGELKRRQEAIGDSLNPLQLSKPYVAAVNAVIDAVCEEWGISKDTLFHAGRQKIVTDPRQAAMEIMRNHLFLTFETVGAVFGKDHGTVIHACNTHESRMSDPVFKRRYRAALHSVKKHSLEAAGFHISTN